MRKICTQDLWKRYCSIWLCLSASKYVNLMTTFKKQSLKIRAILVSIKTHSRMSLSWHQSIITREKEDTCTATTERLHVKTNNWSRNCLWLHKDKICVDVSDQLNLSSCWASKFQAVEITKSEWSLSSESLFMLSVKITLQKASQIDNKCSWKYFSAEDLCSDQICSIIVRRQSIDLIYWLTTRQQVTALMLLCQITALWKQERSSVYSSSTTFSDHILILLS